MQIELGGQANISNCYADLFGADCLLGSEVGRSPVRECLKINRITLKLVQMADTKSRAKTRLITSAKYNGRFSCR